MHVAIAIVGFRNLGDITSCIEALRESNHTDFEVMICENGGPDAFAALTKVLPAALPGGQLVGAVLADRNLGYAGGVNRCIQETPDADAWWVLNPDTRPNAEALRAQLDRLALGDCDAVGSTLHLPNGTVQSHGGRWQKWLARAVSIGHGSALNLTVDPLAIERTQNYLNGASMLISRRFLDVTGPMREDYFLYCEEVEWCLRGVSRGMRLGFAPNALIFHQQGTSTGNQADLHRRPRMPVYLNARNQVLLTRDCYPGILPIVAVGALTSMTLKYARRRAWRQLGYGLSGWWAGIRNERGVPAWFDA